MESLARPSQELGSRTIFSVSSCGERLTDDRKVVSCELLQLLLRFRLLGERVSNKPGLDLIISPGLGSHKLMTLILDLESWKNVKSLASSSDASLARDVFFTVERKSFTRFNDFSLQRKRRFVSSNLSLRVADLGLRREGLCFLCVLLIERLFRPF